MNIGFYRTTMSAIQDALANCLMKQAQDPTWRIPECKEFGCEMYQMGCMVVLYEAIQDGWWTPYVEEIRGAEVEQ